MNELMIIGLISWLAGVASFVGGLFSRQQGAANSRAKRELVHGIVAFGGGSLVSAISFALAPEAVKALSPPVLLVSFCLGGVAFCGLDAYLSRHGGSKAQLLAMLMDFLPEAIALGAIFSGNNQTGFLLALFIGVQNLPEGFNAYREVLDSGVSPRATLGALFAISFLGPAAALCGHLFLRNQPEITACIMSFAAGGILYLIFQDIAPLAKMRRRWAPPLGSVLGFAVGMVGKQLLG